MYKKTHIQPKMEILCSFYTLINELATIIKKEMRYLMTGLLIFVFAFHSYSQNCGLVSKTKNKKTGIESKGGIINSKDYYSLLINKQYDPSNPNDSLNYIVSLVAASRVKLTDSLSQTKGNFELRLINGKLITWENATCFNSPAGLEGAIGFQIKLTERQIREILNQPILRIKVFGILETEIAPNKQKQQQKIVDCLINE
jgi:hypothetical protein